MKEATNWTPTSTLLIRRPASERPKLPFNTNAGGKEVT